MAGSRWRYSPEFKEESVREVVENSRSINEVASSLGVAPQSLGNWVRAYRESHENGEELTVQESAREYSTRNMCAWLKVSRSGYFEWKDRDRCARARTRRDLEERVTMIFAASDQTYGYRRVHAQLARDGYRAHPETVRKAMRTNGLMPCQMPKRGPRTTIPATDLRALVDLVKRDFTAKEPGRKWVGDITYIPTSEGFAYLATVLDCFSKKVIGYAMADHMKTSLITEALTMATRNCRRGRSSTIFHSDRGTQYTSEEFAIHARRLRIRRSVGRTGSCYDNAWAESFNSTLKIERCHRMAYKTINEAIKDVTQYIELRYNQTRLHSGIGYQTPNETEHEWRTSRRTRHT